MATEKISRPTRSVKKPARYQHGASKNAIAAEIGETHENHENSRDNCNENTPTTPVPPTLSNSTPKRRGRPLKAKHATFVAAVVPSSFSADNAVIKGEAVPEILETVASSVASTVLEDFDGYGSDGKPATL